MTAVSGADGPKGRSRVRETATEAAGRPVVRSRTWQVMGSRAAAGGGAAVSGVGSMTVSSTLEERYCSSQIANVGLVLYV